MLLLSELAAFENAMPTDKPTERRPQSFYDDSVLEKLVSEGFVKKFAR